EVKPLFRRAYIIGRRFRLVHVHVGAEVLEVSTFRAPQIAVESTDEHGRLLSDNVYGTQAEDAARRSPGSAKIRSACCARSGWRRKSAWPSTPRPRHPSPSSQASSRTCRRRG